MEINELIQELEKAKGWASKWVWVQFGVCLDACGDEARNERRQASCETEDGARAIAIRHNTAGDVLDFLRSFDTKLDEHRRLVGKAEGDIETIAENFAEDVDLVSAVEAQTKELSEGRGFWEFANAALCMIPGMTWDEDDCESIETNAKRCIGDLVERADRAEAWSEELESQIATARSELGRRFDDIEVDCEGKPNGLEWMINLAGDELNEAQAQANREAGRTERLKARLVTASSIIEELQGEMDHNAFSDSASNALKRSNEYLAEDPTS